MIDTKNYEWVELKYNYHKSWYVPLDGGYVVGEYDPEWWINEEEYLAAVENDSVWKIAIKLIDSGKYVYYLASNFESLMSHVHEKHGGN